MERRFSRTISGSAPRTIRRCSSGSAGRPRAGARDRITWAFAPTLAVVQNPRWGRTYESYSSDPALVRAYGEAMVRGLQGQLGSPTSVLATAKHWLGDGGTFHGKDQGETRTSEANLARTHAAGYYGALKANVQTVMVSYSSFTDTATGKRWGKMHGNAHLVDGVLKHRLGFDGLVVSDWNGIEQVPGCTKWHCPQAINAGIDLVMVPDDWKKFIPATDRRRSRRPHSDEPDRRRRFADHPRQVESGLFDGSPGAGPHPDASVLHSPAVRELAREAVRKSLVLLKNDGGVLPLRRGGQDPGRRQWRRQPADAGRRLVADLAGRPDDDRRLSLCRHLACRAAQVARSRAGRLQRRRQGRRRPPLQRHRHGRGRKALRRRRGRHPFPATMRHSAAILTTLPRSNRVSGKGVPVVTLLYSGRPVGANDLINRSDAFIAAWLPGTEGLGLADMLLAGRDGRAAFDFTGAPFFRLARGRLSPQPAAISSLVATACRWPAVRVRAGLPESPGHGLPARSR